MIELKDSLIDQINNTFNNHVSSSMGTYYKGKVRDNYHLDDKIIMITTDRISAFDHVLGTVPFKGQVLTQLAKFWFDKTSSIVPNHIISSPDPQILIVKKAVPLKVEVIVRGYITGSLWREYEQGIRGQYGFEIPENLKKNQIFDKPILTPSTKADYGLHDEPISREEIISGIVPKDIYEQAEKYAMMLFKEGQDWAKTRGLILVDTKYEFGMYNDELIVIDEIHTPDSSRYWVADEYEERFSAGKDQKMLDKENIRQWLIDRGFSGEGTPPDLSDEIRLEIANSYMDLYELLTGAEFNLGTDDVNKRIKNNLEQAGYNF